MGPEGSSTDKIKQRSTTKLKLVCLTCASEFSEDEKTCPYDGTDLTTIMSESLEGTILAQKYQIEGLLGQGGMSAVYRAKHLMTNKIVAIKVLHPHLAKDTASIRRFQQEAKAASALSHTHVMTAHDFGVTDDGRAYLVLEYMEGVSLSALIEQEGPLPAQRCVTVCAQALEGLSHAHQHNVVHRDLNPSNIMLVKADDGSDKVKLVDFGLAKQIGSSDDVHKVTQSGELFGSPLYMGPELYKGRKGDERSDIYAMGCVVYECLTGDPPLFGDTVLDTILKHMNEFPAEIGSDGKGVRVGDALNAAVLRALEKNPDDRYQTAAQFREALLATQDAATGLALPGYRLNRAVRTNRKKLIIAGSIAVAGVLMLAIPLSIPHFRHVTFWQVYELMGSLAENSKQLSDSVTWYSNAANEAAQDEDLLNKRILSLQDLARAQRQFGRYADADTVDRQITSLRGKALKDSFGFGAEAVDESVGEKILAAPDPSDREKALDRIYALQVAVANAMNRQSFAAAQKMMMKILNLQEKWLPAGDPAIAATLSDLGTWNVRQGNFAEAEVFWQKALDMRKVSAHKIDPAFIWPVLNMGRMRKHQGRTAEAEALIKEGIELTTKNFGPNDARLLDGLQDYAALLKDTGRLDEARKIEERLESIRARIRQ